jgi:hypothetical protein
MSKKPLHHRSAVVDQGEEITDEFAAEVLAYGDAIMAGLEEVCKERTAAGLPLDMLAIVTALSSVVAHYIAGIPDDEARTAYFARAGHEIRDMIKTNLELGTHAQTWLAGRSDLQ